MVTLMKLMSDEELLENEANIFANLCDEDEPASNDMNAGIDSSDDLAKIFDRAISSPVLDYKKLVSIGRGDF